jgi:hypothetical protein
VGFRVFRGSLDRRAYRGAAKVAERREEEENFGGRRMKRNAEAGRALRKTLRRVSESGGRSFVEMER